MLNLNKQPTILIVDDSPESIHHLISILKNEYSIKVATSADKALEVLSHSSSIDLILLDIIMPQVDGYGLCKLLKNSIEFAEIPIIFITSKESVDDESLAFLVGATDYIRKPFAPVVVRSRIRNQINLYQRTLMLEELAQIDGLTQLSNRRYLDNELPKLWRVTLKEELSLAIAMIDIDHFKAYNDNYGHQTGDTCLIEFSRLLNNHALSLSKKRIVARYGGEEFTIAVVINDPKTIKDWVKKLIQGVHKLKIRHDFSSVSDHITISIGLAIIDNSDLVDISPQTGLQFADQALYEAKTTGRNKLVILNSNRRIDKVKNAL